VVPPFEVTSWTPLLPDLSSRTNVRDLGKISRCARNDKETEEGILYIVRQLPIRGKGGGLNRAKRFYDLNGKRSEPLNDPFLQ
jgi:hypothetical protein